MWYCLQSKENDLKPPARSVPYSLLRYVGIGLDHLRDFTRLIVRDYESSISPKNHKSSNYYLNSNNEAMVS